MRNVVLKRKSFQDEPYLSKLDAVSYQPIFIMGLHRSGTTLLYELLGKSGAFNIITAYHALHYDELLANYFEGTAMSTRQELNDWFAAQHMENRLFDHIKLNADMPEEYAMILHAKAGSMSLNKRNFPVFDQLCRKIQLISDRSLPLLLKNPFDFINFLKIKEMKPMAKFVFIFRNPIQILNSQLIALHKSMTSNDPYIARLSKSYSLLQRLRPLIDIIRWVTNPSSRGQIIRRFLVWKIISQMNYYIYHIEFLPRTEYVELRYEDLCEKPTELIRSIFDFLGMEPRIAMDFSLHVHPRSLKLLATLARDEVKLQAKFKRIMAYNGYM